MKVDLLFPFLLLSLLLLDAINSLMKIEDYRQKQQPVRRTIYNITDEIKPTHRCGHDQKSSVFLPIPVILQNNETNHSHQLPTNNIPSKSGIIARFACRYLAMYWICAHTYMCIQGCTCIEATLPSPFWRFFSASSNRPGKWITTPLPAR